MILYKITIKYNDQDDEIVYFESYSSTLEAVNMINDLDMKKNIGIIEYYSTELVKDLDKYTTQYVLEHMSLNNFINMIKLIAR